MRILVAAIGRLKDAGEKDLFARYLAEYAAVLELDVRTGVTVEEVVPDGDGWVARTAQDYVPARAMVATGRHNEPFLPDPPRSCRRSAGAPMCARPS